MGWGGGGGVASKETAVLRRWGVEAITYTYAHTHTMFGLSTELITKWKLATVKRFEC